MENENYLEESVTMCDEARTIAKRKYIIFAILFWMSNLVAVLAGIVVIFAGAWLFIIAVVGFAVLSCYIWLYKLKIIYECDYICVGNSLRIAKIFAGQRRRALAVVEFQNVKALGECSPEKLQSFKDRKKEDNLIVATPNAEFKEQGIFYCIYEDVSKTTVVFEPSKKMLIYIAKQVKKGVLHSE